VRQQHTESSNSGENENEHFYQRPSYIHNLLLIDRNSGRLLPDLQEHFDFITVSFSVWDTLQSWYGCDQKICRRLVKEPYSNELKLDIYPEQHCMQSGTLAQGTIVHPDRRKVFSDFSLSSIQSCDFVEGKQLDFQLPLVTQESQNS
jgi:hypothetical protein